MLTLLLVVLVASYYQLKIDERRLVVAPIAAISSGKCDGGTTASSKNGGFYGKPFELFQMRPLGSTNSLADGTHSPCEMDVNGNRHSTDMAELNNDPNTTSTSGSMTGKSEMTDYQVETGSCAGAAGTYEAEQPIGKSPERSLELKYYNLSFFQLSISRYSFALPCKPMPRPS